MCVTHIFTARASNMCGARSVQFLHNPVGHTEVFTYWTNPSGLKLNALNSSTCSTGVQNLRRIPAMPCAGRMVMPCVQHAAFCRYTRTRFESTLGGFSACQAAPQTHHNTQHNTQHTTHNTQHTTHTHTTHNTQHTTHNTQHTTHNTQHTTPHHTTQHNTTQHHTTPHNTTQHQKRTTISTHTRTTHITRAPRTTDRDPARVILDKIWNICSFRYFMRTHCFWNY